jgi:protocatechuate 3,4-dioxygenase, beta subunit
VVGRSASASGPMGYRRDNVDIDPPYLIPFFKSSLLRAPSQPLISLRHTLSEVTGPVFGHNSVQGHESNLTTQGQGAPIGQRIVLSGRVIDGDGRPVPNTLIEMWQANAAGRYTHKWDRYDAPLDPNFSGVGRCLTGAGGSYEFVTVKPGPYPFANHHNAWRPAHIHLSVFGPAFATRLVTQMYFPGDPLLGQDPVFNSVPGTRARERLICRFDLDATIPDWANAYKFDLVLRGPDSTPVER